MRAPRVGSLVWYQKGFRRRKYPARVVRVDVERGLVEVAVDEGGEIEIGAWAAYNERGRRTYENAAVLPTLDPPIVRGRRKKTNREIWKEEETKSEQKKARAARAKKKVRRTGRSRRSR